MQKSPFTKILSFVVKAQHGLSVTHSTKHRNGLKHSWKIQLRFFVDTLKSSKPDQKPTIFPTQPSQNTRTEAFLLTFFCAETMEAMQYVIPLRTKTVWKSRLWLCLKHQTSLMFVPSTSKSKSSYKGMVCKRAVKEIKPVGWWGFLWWNVLLSRLGHVAEHLLKKKLHLKRQQDVSHFNFFKKKLENMCLDCFVFMCVGFQIRFFWTVVSKNVFHIFRNKLMTTTRTS